MADERPMNSWVKGGPTSRLWHQADYDSRTGNAVLCCSGRTVRPLGPNDVMDYRWRPTRNVQCLHLECRRDVKP